MLKVVLIDLDDTILDFKACSHDSIKKAKEELNIKLPDDFYDSFDKYNPTLWEKVEKGLLKTSTLFEIRFKELFKMNNIDGDYNLFEDTFRKYLKESHVLLPYAKELLEYLHTKYKVYGASNSSTAKEKRLKLAGVYNYFDGLFVSEVVGYQKPQKEFFLHVLKELNITKDEVIMIGDSLTSDIIGAYNLGIKSIWFNKDNIKKEDPIIDLEVKRLEDIKKYI